MTPKHNIQRFKKDDPERPRRIARKAAVCRYLGRSQMTLFRWMKNPALGFPKPHRIADVDYLDLDEVDAWLKSKVMVE